MKAIRRLHSREAAAIKRSNAILGSQRRDQERADDENKGRSA